MVSIFFQKESQNHPITVTFYAPKYLNVAKKEQNDHESGHESTSKFKLNETKTTINVS